VEEEDMSIFDLPDDTPSRDNDHSTDLPPKTPENPSESLMNDGYQSSNPDDAIEYEDISCFKRVIVIEVEVNLIETTQVSSDEQEIILVSTNKKAYSLFSTPPRNAGYYYGFDSNQDLSSPQDPCYYHPSADPFLARSPTTSGYRPSPRHTPGDAYGYSPANTVQRRKRRNAFSPRRSYYSEEDEPEYVDYLVDDVICRVPTRGDAETPRRHRQSSSIPRRSDTPPRPSTATAKKPPPTPKATEADARKHRIPSGYSLRNWDPSEEPIMLLGSVFDANSLGKWIYDWTVYHHGPATEISEMAGELWLLLIQLANKVKRAEECMPRIRTPETREMVDDFIETGERLTDKFKKLLKSCETPMLKAGKKHGKDSAQLGKNAGTEFVDSIFGRDRQLEATEKFMSSIRLWNLRFDANCEDILRRPGQ
jgi:hypothetical protein